MPLHHFSFVWLMLVRLLKIGNLVEIGNPLATQSLFL